MKKKNKGHRSREDERWRGKKTRGKFQSNLDGKLVANEKSCRWLKFGETESTVVPAKGQAFSIFLKK